MASKRLDSHSSLSSLGWIKLWLLISLVHLITIAAASRGMKLANLTVDRRLRRNAKLANTRNQLRRINKPAVLSIHSPDGDIIDCVSRDQQLALDHPELKNHKIQTKPPSIWPVSSSANATGTKRFQQLWLQKGGCPKNTISVRRTTAEDILRAGSRGIYGRKAKASSVINPLTQPQSVYSAGHEHAIAYTIGTNYYGARASVNVWQPGIAMPYEFSLSQIWLLAGSFAGDLNTIEAGWQVSPELYGDYSPRLFTYWTSDAYQTTGCYNLLCSGFVQVANDVAIGAAISPVSSLGLSQFDIEIMVWKDSQTSNWWMLLGGNSVVGYWPAEMFSHLSVAANMIQWGGEVVNSEPDGHHSSTQMGSGHFPSEGFGRASYFRNLGYIDANYQIVSEFDVDAFSDHPNCYDIQLSYSSTWQNYFYYGGPGLSPTCP